MTEQIVDGQPLVIPKQFAIDKLFDASSVAKKLREGSYDKDGRTWFVDGEQEFTPAEVTILKELFDGNSDKWTILEADTVQELKELFDGK